MKNIYHSDIYKFNTPVKSYWEDNSQENLNLEKLTKDVKSEIVVIGGDYTGLLCAMNCWGISEISAHRGVEKLKYFKKLYSY